MQFIKPTIIRTSCKSIYTNLGFESYLFQQCIIQSPILFLWQNDKTIVIGRHQNPWKECNLQLMEQDKVTLCRRNSGGGAVYQDLGNHCFTFITPYSGNIDPKTYNNSLLVDALAALNIEAVMSGRNDLHVQGLKVSGSAYQLSLGNKINPHKIALHHGTMMIDVDSTALSKYLTPSKKKLQSKGVDSVTARVMNLINVNPYLTIPLYEQALHDQFVHKYPDSESIQIGEQQMLQITHVNDTVTKLTSQDWLYSYTPDFTVNLEERFQWGGIDIYLQVEHNVIKEAKVYSDSLYPDYITALNEILIGIQYSFDGVAIISQQLNAKFEQHAQMTKDLHDWLIRAI